MRVRTDNIPFEMLTAVGEGAPSPSVKAQLLKTLREQSPEVSAAVDAFFINRVEEQLVGLHKAKENIDELRVMLERLTAPPLSWGRFLGEVEGEQPMALVAVANNRLILNVAEGVDLDAIAVGDEVVLNQKHSAILGPTPFKSFGHGQTACFVRMLGEDRMVIRTGDEETIIGIAASAGTEFKHGDMVRWDSTAQLALENIPQDNASEFQLEAIPDLPLSSVGGQQANLQRLISALTLVFTQPETAKRYKLGGLLRAILLHGSPGTGKTLLAKVAGSHLQKLLGKKCHICVIKPGQFEDPYVGVTQRKIRECFRAVRETEGFTLVFFDEIESIGRTRGGMVNQHSDKFLGALLVELQGMDERGNDSCAVIAATNRLDMLDPALVSRMELQLAIGRPDQRAARDIFAIHLAEQLPYHENGHPGSVTREKIIDRAVSLFYSPSGSGALCTVKFRDATQRVITSRELASGRLFEQVCRAARQTAAFREVDRGTPGLLVEDIEEAVTDAQAKLGASLTRYNIHQYVSDLKQDMEVVAVEPIVRHVAKPHRYINHT